MPLNLVLVVYPVKDSESAKRLFTTLLGTEPYVDSPYYIGYRAGAVEIGLDPHGHSRGSTGPIPYWTTSDIKQSVKKLVDAGAVLQQDVTDVGGGLQIALLKDADGNIIGLRSA